MLKNNSAGSCNFGGKGGKPEMHVKKEDKTVQIVRWGLVWRTGLSRGCGVEVYIKDGRVIKVEGDLTILFAGKNLSASFGTTQLMYHPDRLKYLRKG